MFAEFGHLLPYRHDDSDLYGDRHGDGTQHGYLHLYHQRRSLRHHLSRQYHGAQRRQSVRRGGELCADSDAGLWHGDLLTSIGQFLPERHDDGAVHDDSGAELFVYRNGQRHPAADAGLSAESDAGDVGARRDDCGGELSGADSNRQLSGSDGGLFTALGFDVYAGSDDGHLHGDRRGDFDGDV